MPTLPLPRPRLRRSVPGGGSVLLPGEIEVAEPEIIEASGLRWVHIEEPRLAHREWLEEHFDFHPLDFEDVYSRNQRPKLDSYDDYIFIVLHFPYFEKSSGRLLSAELDLFIGPDYLVTLPDSPLPPLNAMFDRLRNREDLREQNFSKGSGYLLYKIVDTNVDASFPMLRKMGNKLDRLEDDIFEGRSSEIVRDISNAKQEIINFRKIVRPQRAVLRDLERTKQRYLAEELEIYFDDISDAAERIWDTLENYKEVVEALESTNESVLGHRLNDSFRILTATSVILLPLTLIASIFGMNVHFPGEGEALTFFAILGLMAVMLLTLVVVFRRRGWL
ncbi:MAG TPA: magnesium transporter CorA family protein [Candidatus Limnocylindrales bacterium]|nr:magnesium transporter CorA family protein [Candidatus Limnocylindrales bacterium]